MSNLYKEIIMDKKRKKELTATLVSNDDYFFRDSEMQRVDLNNPKHQTDPTFENDKDEKK